MSERPVLDRDIDLADFRRAYWLKRELIDFCRTYGLPVSGGKRDLAHRIEVFLETGEVLRPAVKRVKRAEMPERFTRQTVIEPGWRCSQALRGFFEQEIGPQFHFNGVMRAFIKEQGVGRTLQEAIDAWLAGRQQPRAEKKIAPQFEYNAHIRAFFETHEGATLQDAIAAWHEKKAERNAHGRS